MNEIQEQSEQPISTTYPCDGCFATKCAICDVEIAENVGTVDCLSTVRATLDGIVADTVTNIEQVMTLWQDADNDMAALRAENAMLREERDFYRQHMVTLYSAMPYRLRIGQIQKHGDEWQHIDGQRTMQDIFNAELNTDTAFQLYASQETPAGVLDKEAFLLESLVEDIANGGDGRCPVCRALNFECGGHADTQTPAPDATPIPDDGIPF